MKINRKIKCNLCGREVDVQAGGCYLQIAICQGHTTSMISTSFCKECYDEHLDEPMRALDEHGRLGMYFDEKENGHG